MGLNTGIAWHGILRGRVHPDIQTVMSLQHVILLCIVDGTVHYLQPSITHQNLFY